VTTQFIVSDQTNPYLNIAVENYLVEYADSIVLYLWRNRRTVVIGQNQNPYSEVNLEALNADGGYLMRRRTGGGAVYHDDGNLNFSFIVPKDLYDQTRQFAVIQRAVESFGLHTELSGRNDILVEGRKFSGNAFSKGRINDLHHGTLLISGDMSDLQRYLKPKPAKLQKHGVSSVRSRVVNLAELNPTITPESITPRLREAFLSEYSEYAESSEYANFSEIVSCPDVQRLYAEFASEEWLYGRWRTFTAQRTAQFDWGGVELSITIDQEHNRITDVQIATDALDLGALDLARQLLLGADTTKRPALPDGPCKPILSDLLSLVY
jgi:lipoate-protein ligase A